MVLNVSESILLRLGDEYDEKEIEEKIGMPCFIKPATDGSSLVFQRLRIQIK